MAWLGVLGLCLSAQTSPVVEYRRIMQGPMLGAVSTETAKIWCRVSGEFPVQIEYSVRSDMESAVTSPPLGATRSSDFTAQIQLAGLKPGTEYYYRVLVDGKVDRYHRDREPFRFQTAPSEPSRLRVMFGSCARWSFDREQPIWNVIADSRPDLFLWLGDNIYGDALEPTILAEEFRRQREVPRYQALMSSIPQLALWDDHDFGLNNTGKEHPRKAEALQVWKNYWPNPSHGLEDVPGIFFAHEIPGVEFFFIDGRYHRDPNEGPDGEKKSMLGPGQRKWLIRAIKQSRAPFKVIASGGGWNNGRGPTGDAWSAFLTERNLIFKEIADVPGVLLISGDTHFAELNRIPREKNYPLYEFVSSPLAQRPNATAPDLRDGETRVWPAFTTAANVGALDFDFTGTDPEVRWSVFTPSGQRIREPFRLRLSELQPK